MSRRLALAALLLFTSPSWAQDAGWRTYSNPRFGVSAEYPVAFSRHDEPPVNGDGQGFTTPDGRAHLIIFGSYNVDHQNPAQLMAERKETGTRYSYQKAAKNWFALSGTHDGQITYVRCNLGRGDVVGCAHLEYPVDDAAKWSKTVARVSASLGISGGSGN